MATPFDARRMMTAFGRPHERHRRAGYALTLFRKDADGTWPLARDANLLTAVAG